jgi:hypothetical protein
MKHKHRWQFVEKRYDDCAKQHISSLYFACECGLWKRVEAKELKDRREG